MQRTRAAALARDLISRAPRGSITCIFAGGSLGRGEVWAATIGAGLEIYSDVDLYVVTSDDAVLAPVRAAAATLAAAAPGVDGVHFLRPPDLGVYTLGDLRAQPVRPGTVDLAVHHLVLEGDRDLPGRLPAPDVSSIPASEALYLLENRLGELSGGPAPDERAARLRVMRALKARLDVHSAHAIVARTFAPTLDARARQVAAHAPDTLDAESAADVADAYRAAADVTAWIAGREEGAEIDRARAALVRAWLALAPVVLDCPGARAETLVARRCHAGAYRENAREFIRLRHAFSIPMWRALLSAPSLARLSPRAALRADALVRECGARDRYDARALRAHDRYVDRLTRRLGHAAGSLEMRAQSLRRVIS